MEEWGKVKTPLQPDPSLFNRQASSAAIMITTDHPNMGQNLDPSDILRTF